MTNAKLKILVAEDHPINQEIIKAILEHHGFHCTAVANGLQVMDRLALEVFDVILMDMEMPLMDGCETTQAIRQMEQSTGRHVRIIALTANNKEADREFCINAGMDDFLAKPIDPEAMIAMIQSKPARAAGGEARHGQSADEPALKIFNVAALQSRLLGQKLPSVKMASLFLKDLPNTLAEIDHGLARQDLAHVARFAHRMGGAAAMLGAEQLALLAEELEDDASVGSFNTLPDLNAKLKTMAAILSVELQAFVDNQN